VDALSSFIGAYDREIDEWKRNSESWRVKVMVFNTTFHNISAISCWSALLVEESRVPRENHGPAANDWQTLSHNIVSSTPRLSSEFILMSIVG
jgi:hypothetical protein